MKPLRQLVRTVGRAAFSPMNACKARSRLSRLERATNPLAKALGHALRAVRNGNVSADEKGWIDRIESLRRELSTSSAKIAMADYGAGSRASGLTAEQPTRRETATRSIADTCRCASVPPQEALLLFRLIRAFKPSVCLEMGTSLGISAAYQAAALELNGYGRIVTLEGEESLVRLARQNFERLGLDRVTVVPGRFQDTLADVAREQAPLDFAFIDGHHDEHATVAYYRQILPHVGPGAVLVFDDISWSPGMGRAWKTIAEDERVGLAVDVSGVGICVVSDSLANQPTLRIPIL